tara:strand:+ start:21251 stop:22066 length:816 start_codon:yes stop_codon:yes gene_type:complete
MKKFAVIGKPIKHTLSPRIHSEFAKKAGIDISYEAIEVDPKNFKQETIKLFKSGYEGLNVTLPLKELALDLADEISEMGLEAGAVNTLWKDKDKIFADSTDGKGFLDDLVNNQISLKDKELVILGAGGASRSIIPSIISLGPKKVTLLNRTFERASDLAKHFTNRGVEVEALRANEIPVGKIEGVINTTSAGITGGNFTFNPELFNEVIWTYDLSYSKEATYFNQLAKNLGVQICLDGLGMLVNQAAGSFQIWTGIEPETEEVFNLIKNTL